MSSNIKRYNNELTFSAKRHECNANCNLINTLKQITFLNNSLGSSNCVGWNDAAVKHKCRFVLAYMLWDLCYYNILFSTRLKKYNIVNNNSFIVKQNEICFSYNYLKVFNSTIYLFHYIHTSSFLHVWIRIQYKVIMMETFIIAPLTLCLSKCQITQTTIVFLLL